MPNSTFFDKLAAQWDKTRMPDDVKIAQLIEMCGLSPGDKVLDVGSGTGVLIPFVKNVVGPEGYITAIDYSAKMIERAEDKFKGLGGIDFVVSDIMEFTNEVFYDAVLCLNFFPHIGDKPAFFHRVADMLADKGKLIIMHDISRQAVNGVHQSCEKVKNDLLPPGEAVQKLLIEAGYDAVLVVDSDDRYFIKALRNNN